MRVFLIRHLQTKYNLNSKMMGRKIDAKIMRDTSSINKLSRKIFLLRKTFNLNPDNIELITSPMLRCKETSYFVAKALGYVKTAKVMENFNETDMGSFSGVTMSELRQKHPALVKKWGYNPEKFKFPNGESYGQVIKRSNEGLNSLLKSTPKDVFIVTHVDIIKVLITSALGITFNSRHLFLIPNGSVSVMVYDNEVLKIESLNV